MPIRILIILLGLAMCSLSASAQCLPAWLPGERPPGLGPAPGITCFTMWDPDGPGPLPEWLVVGGTFSTAGGGAVSANNIAAWDGSAWHAIGTGLSGQVNALAVFNGELYAGGSFTFGTPAIRNIARWNGSAWVRLAQGVTGPVNALTVYDSGGGEGPQLIVAGSFTSAGPLGANNIAAWDGAFWSTLDAGLSMSAQTVVTYNGLLLAGGSSVLNNTGLRAWDGVAWSTYGGASSSVYALAVVDGRLMVSGFHVAGTLSSLSSFDDSTWTRLDATLPVGSVGPMVSLNGMLVIGGYFSQGPQPYSSLNILYWDALTSFWRPLGTDTYNFISALTVYHGQILAGGSGAGLNAMSALPVSTGVSIATWDGFTWKPLDPGTDNAVGCFGEHAGRLVAGGNFTTMSSAAANHIAQWDGIDWTPFAGGLDGEVTSVTDHNGELYAGGRFTQTGGPGGIPAAHVARWDGSAWRAVGLGAGGLDDNVLATASWNGKLIVAGEFTHAGGLPANRVAAWDGTSWSALGVGFSSPVNSLWVYNGDLYAGVFKWTGTTWQQIPGPGDLAGPMMVANGVAYSGTYNQTTATWGMRRLDGTIWTALGNTIPAFTISALGISAGRPVMGGALKTGTLSADMQVVGLSGSGPAATWQPLGAGMGFPISKPYVRALALFHGELLAGGLFTSAGSAPSAYFARWSETGIPWIARQPAASTRICAGQSTALSVTPATGYTPITYQWRRNGTPLADTGRFSGTATPTLSITAALGADGGQFDCLVSNTCGSVPSAPAHVVVCAADFSCDGALNLTDVFGFLAAWFVSDPLADFDGDGCNIPDIFAFLTMWFAGCP